MRDGPDANAGLSRYAAAGGDVIEERGSRAADDRFNRDRTHDRDIATCMKNGQPGVRAEAGLPLPFPMNEGRGLRAINIFTTPLRIQFIQ